MGFVINTKSVFSAYNDLSEEQKERFFQGEEAQAIKAIGSLTYILGTGFNYKKLFELYITAAVRVLMGFDNERIEMTLLMRFSDILPKDKSLTVIECIRRISNNYAYIDSINSPEAQAMKAFFDSQYEESFSENEKRLNDAIKNSGFGIDPDNPIFTHSAEGSYSYLNLLFTSDNVPLTWSRVGPIEVPSSRNPVDKYDLYLPDGTVFLSVFINMYSRRNSEFCPQGLIGDGLKATTVAVSNKMGTVEDDEEEMSEEEEYLAFLQNYSKNASTPKSEPKSTALIDESSSGTDKRNKANSFSEEQQTAEDDEVLWENTVPVLQGDLPVLLSGITIFKRNNGEIYAICTFFPLTDKSIRAMEVAFLCYDVWREKVQSVEGVFYNDLRTTRRAYFGADHLIPLPDLNTRTLEVSVRRIMLSDGTLLKRDGDNVEFPPLERIEERFNNAELIKEYKTLTYQNVKFVPVKIGDCWRCTCGAFNRADEHSCYECSDSAETLFKNLDIDLLHVSLSEKKRLQREKEERDRLAREEARKKEEKERKARELKAAEEARQRAERIRIRNKRIALVGAGLVIASVLVYLIGWQIVPAQKYKAAERLLDSGDIEAAYSAFLELGKFNDSFERAQELIYTDAQKALDSGDYEKAIKLFGRISDYKDSSDQAVLAVYKRAELLMNTGSFSEAAVLFESISGFRDSEVLGEKCRSDHSYYEAVDLFKNGKYKEAGEAFEQQKAYRDSASFAVRSYYLYAQDLIKNGKLHDAYLVLSTKVNQGSVSYEDSVELAYSVEYQYASDCFDNEDYHDAADSFANLGDYKDSTAQCLESRYQYASVLISNNDYAEAEKLFAVLGDYKDSAKQLKEAKYQNAVQLMSDKKYQDAEKRLEELGKNYKDCAKLLQEARYQHALTLVNKKEYIQAVDLFKALGSYRDSVEQWKSAMYGYVLAHENNTDLITYDYLSVLKQFNYKNSCSIYDALYEWRAKIVYLNTNEKDFSTVNKTISKTAPYVHFSFVLEGGPPGEKTKLKCKVFWPGYGSISIFYSAWDYYSRGDRYYLEFPDGKWDLTWTSKTGNTKIQICLMPGEKPIGETIIQLT